MPLMDFATRLTKQQEMRRVMIRGIKMCEVSKPNFEERFGVPMHAVFGREIDDLLARGLIEEDESVVRLTREGQVFSSHRLRGVLYRGRPAPTERQRGAVRFV